MKKTDLHLWWQAITATVLMVAGVALLGAVVTQWLFPKHEPPQCFESGLVNDLTELRARGDTLYACTLHEMAKPPAYAVQWRCEPMRAVECK